MGELVVLKAVFVHDPVGPGAMGGAAIVEHESLLHADDAAAAVDGAVLAGGLPVSPGGGAVGMGPVRVLAVDGTEEVPLQVAALEAGAAGQLPRLALAQINLSDDVNA